MMLNKFISIVFLSSCLSIAAEKEVITPLTIGSAAPSFSLSGTDGETYTLESFKEAKMLLVVFTSNHCPDARASRQRINTFAKDYKAKGVEVVAISGNDPSALSPWELGYSVYGDTFEEMKIVSKEEGYVHPFLYDGKTQVVSKAYGALATPHCFVFDAERKLIYQGRFDNGRRNPGPASENNVIDIVNSTFAGQVVDDSKKTTRPFGCSTKWSWKGSNVQKVQDQWNALPVTVAPLSLEDAKKLAENKTNKVRVINFWSTTCGPCIAEFPDLSYINQRFSKRPFEVITVSLDDKADANAVATFLQTEHMPVSPQKAAQMKAEGRTTNNYHFMSDELDKLAETFDAKWQGPIPHTVVIAPGGEISYRHSGQLDPVELTRAIVLAIEKATSGKKH